MGFLSISSFVLLFCSVIIIDIDVDIDIIIEMRGPHTNDYATAFFEV